MDHQGILEIPEEEVDAIVVTDKTTNLYELLVSCNLVHFFNAFVNEEIDDDVLAILDPQGTNFTAIVSKIFPKIGSFMKFSNALAEFQKKVQKDQVAVGEENIRNNSEDDIVEETPSNYNFFNEHEDLAKIIERYGKTKYFDEQKRTLGPLSLKARKKLIKIIVDWSVRDAVWFSLKDYPKVCDKIKDIFPKECTLMYFIPKGPGNKNPSGLLYNTFRRRHADLKKESGLRKNQKSMTKKMPADQEKTIIELPKNVELLRQDLINRSEPWDSVMKWWKDSFESRREEVLKYPLAKVLERWPKFKNQPNGVKMIESDFEKLHPGKNLIFSDEWKKFSSEILKLAKAKAESKKEKEDVLEIFSVEEDDVFYNINVLKALIYLVPGSPRKKDEHGPHRIGKIVQYIEYTQNVMDKVKKVADNCSVLHPFIICATTNNIPVKYYLSVYDGIFTYDTFPGCLNMLFQSFFSLDVEYPSEVYSVYQFIQNFFYGIRLSRDKNLTNIISLISKLDHERLG